MSGPSRLFRGCQRCGSEREQVIPRLIRERSNGGPRWRQPLPRVRRGSGRGCLPPAGHVGRRRPAGRSSSSRRVAAVWAVFAGNRSGRSRRIRERGTEERFVGVEQVDLDTRGRRGCARSHRPSAIVRRPSRRIRVAYSGSPPRTREPTATPCRRLTFPRRASRNGGRKRSCQRGGLRPATATTTRSLVRSRTAASEAATEARSRAAWSERQRPASRRGHPWPRHLPECARSDLGHRAPRRVGCRTGRGRAAGRPAMAPLRPPPRHPTPPARRGESPPRRRPAPELGGPFALRFRPGA